MKWESVVSELIEEIQENVTDDDVRYNVYLAIIKVFENADCNALKECLREDAMFDMAYNDHFGILEDEEDSNDYDDDKLWEDEEE